MKLVIDRVIQSEIIHHCDIDTKITSKCNRMKIEHGKMLKTVCLPLSIFKKLVSIFRLARRVMRTDKSVFYPVCNNGRLEAVIGVYQKNFYRIDWPTMAVRKTGKFQQGRVPLHQSICETEKGNFFLGEYSSNKKNISVPVWKSDDKGNSWKIVFEFPRDKARHIHGCFWDTFEKKVWVCTGDFEGECHIICADEDFKNIEWLSDGTQVWRTCHLIFKKDYVFWGMDSPLSQSFVCGLDRKTRTPERIFKVPGPIWYAKELEDGWMLFASAIENGPFVKGEHACIFATQDGLGWHEIYKVRKDKWPTIPFKSGVIAFASGRQNSSCFYFFAEALDGIDGKVIQCRIQS
jgi:hypothetical protein